MGSALERHAAGQGALAVRETTRELAAASVSANTRRAYEGALDRLRDWLDGRTLDDATLAEYLADRFEAGHSPAAAGQVVAAVRFYAKLGGQSSPVGPATERVLAGFRREGRARGRGQVVGVRWEQADAAAAVAGSSGGSVRGLRDAAARPSSPPPRPVAPTLPCRSGRLLPPRVRSPAPPRSALSPAPPAPAGAAAPSPRASALTLSRSHGAPRQALAAPPPRANAASAPIPHGCLSPAAPAVGPDARRVPPTPACSGAPDPRASSLARAAIRFQCRRSSARCQATPAPARILPPTSRGAACSGSTPPLSRSPRRPGSRSRAGVRPGAPRSAPGACPAPAPSGSPSLARAQLCRSGASSLAQLQAHGRHMDATTNSLALHYHRISS